MRANLFLTTSLLFGFGALSFSASANSDGHSGTQANEALANADITVNSEQALYAITKKLAPRSGGLLDCPKEKVSPSTQNWYQWQGFEDWKKAVAQLPPYKTPTTDPATITKTCGEAGNIFLSQMPPSSRIKAGTEPAQNPSIPLLNKARESLQKSFIAYCQHTLSRSATSRIGITSNAADPTFKNEYIKSMEAYKTASLELNKISPPDYINGCQQNKNSNHWAGNDFSVTHDEVLAAASAPTSHQGPELVHLGDVSKNKLLQCMKSEVDTSEMKFSDRQGNTMNAVNYMPAIVNSITQLDTVNLAVLTKALSPASSNVGDVDSSIRSLVEAIGNENQYKAVLHAMKDTIITCNQKISGVSPAAATGSASKLANKVKKDHLLKCLDSQMEKQNNRKETITLAEELVKSYIKGNTTDLNSLHKIFEDLSTDPKPVDIFFDHIKKYPYPKYKTSYGDVLKSIKSNLIACSDNITKSPDRYDDKVQLQGGRLRPIDR